MKFFEATHRFNHSWAEVTAANWMKYPNEQCPHVIAVDVLDRHVDPETGVLRTERLLTCNQNAPALVLKVQFIFRARSQTTSSLSYCLVRFEFQLIKSI